MEGRKSRLHSTVVSTVTSPEEGPGFKIGGFCMFSSWLLMFCPTTLGSFRREVKLDFVTKLQQMVRLAIVHLCQPEH